MGETKNANTILAGKPNLKTPLERTKRRCGNNIKVDRKEIVCEDVNWIHLTQDGVVWRTLVNTVMNLRAS
jgi:predicted RNA-binding protein